jgi:hypothetical protein
VARARVREIARETAMDVLGKDRLVLEPRGKSVATELTPVEARSGVISGRIVSVLIVSSLSALAAMSAIWWFTAH